MRQVAATRNVRRAIAKVGIGGPFGEPVTQAAVSPQLLLGYRDLFSNRSDKLLREEGFIFEARPRQRSTELVAKGANNKDNITTSENNRVI